MSSAPTSVINLSKSIYTSPQNDQLQNPFVMHFVKVNKWFAASALQTLSAAWYKHAMKSLKPVRSQETMKMIYSPYIHSIKNYELIFWGKSSHGATIIKVKKNKIKIITGSRSTDSCRDLFTSLKILPFQSQ